MNNPDYIVVPMSVVGDKRLHDFDSKLYGIIYWMNGFSSGVKGANKTFARILNCSIRGVEQSLKRMVDAGKISITYKDTAKRHRLMITPLVRMRDSQTTQTSGLGKTEELVDHSNEWEKESINSLSLSNVKNKEADADTSAVLSSKATEAVRKMNNKKLQSDCLKIREEYGMGYEQITGEKPALPSVGTVMKIAGPRIKQFGLEVVQGAMVRAMLSKDPYYKSRKYPFPLMVSASVINKFR